MCVCARIKSANINRGYQTISNDVINIKQLTDNGLKERRPNINVSSSECARAPRMAWQAKNDVCACESPGTGEPWKAACEQRQTKKLNNVSRFTLYARMRWSVANAVVTQWTDVQRSRLPAGRQKIVEILKQACGSRQLKWKTQTEFNSASHEMHYFGHFCVRPFAVGLGYGRRCCCSTAKCWPLFYASICRVSFMANMKICGKNEIHDFQFTFVWSLFIRLSAQAHACTQATRPMAVVFSAVHLAPVAPLPKRNHQSKLCVCIHYIKAILSLFAYEMALVQL